MDARRKRPDLSNAGAPVNGTNGTFPANDADTVADIPGLNLAPAAYATLARNCQHQTYFVGNNAQTKTKNLCKR